MSNLIATPSQTVGPFFHIGMDSLQVSDLVPDVSDDQAVTLRGQVLDGDRLPVTDALIEIWQADERGNYCQADGGKRNATDSHFRGLGRVATDSNGAFTFRTIKPGRVVGREGHLQAPHIAVNVFMRGLLRHLVTRIYFPDEPSNDQDFLLGQVVAHRRHTLIAKKSQIHDRELMWNIVLQGESETVFFDC